MVTFLFYFFEAMAALSAIGLLFIKNVFHGALLLIACLLSLAALYIFGNAEFIAVTQILIYAGGVLLLIIFGIMLTSKFSDKPLTVKHQYLAGGSLISLVIFGGLIKIFSQIDINKTRTSQSGNDIKEIGVLLMSDYVLPFEIAGLLLLITLVGAATVAASIKSKHTS